MAIEDEDHLLNVETTFLEPFSATISSCWMFIGEINIGCDGQLYLKARVCACMNNLDLFTFKKALEIQRKYLSQKYDDS